MPLPGPKKSLVDRAGEATADQPAVPADGPSNPERGASQDVGVLLIVTGVAGILLPGPVGTPLLILGCVLVWPRAFDGVERFFKKRFPRTYRLGALQGERFLSDLERRYPLPR
jgi:hypothetical protein